MPKQLFIVWTYTRWGGAQTYSIAIAKHALNEWDVTFVIPAASSPDLVQRLSATGARIEYLPHAFDARPVRGILAKIRRQWLRIQAQRGVLSALPADRLRGSVVHIEAPPWQDWVLLTILARRGARVFVTIHNMFSTESRLRAAIWKARFRLLAKVQNLRILVTSKFGLEALNGWVPDPLLARTSLTRPGMDLREVRSVLSEEPPRRRLLSTLDIDEHAPVILTVGQFVDRKGPWQLLAAAERIISRQPNAVFIWVTPELPDRNAIERVESYQLNRNFMIVPARIIGPDHADILRAMRMADVFVLPSLLEGFPIALTEAMAIGLPCVSTRVQGIPEAVHDGETGLLVPPGDADALARAISELLDNAGLRRQLAENAAVYASHNFDETATAELIIEQYRSSLAR
jgi:glycosyltransferase involved in cell wall biosynthesis